MVSRRVQSTIVHPSASMPPSDPRRRSSRAKGRAKPKTAAPRAAKRVAGADDSFLDAFVKLLRSRRIRAPQGLVGAPPEAYASQEAAFVARLAQLSDADLKVYAERIAGYARRQQERAKTAWESSALVAELRRRGLREPAVPVRVVGASVSLARPLKDWSDDEVLRAADEWSRMGQA